MKSPETDALVEAAREAAPAAADEAHFRGESTEAQWRAGYRALLQAYGRMARHARELEAAASS